MREALEGESDRLFAVALDGGEDGLRAIDRLGMYDRDAMLMVLPELTAPLAGTVYARAELVPSPPSSSAP